MSSTEQTGQTQGRRHDHTCEMTRVLGRLDVVAVAFGAMIGFGWIVLTGGFLEEAGTLGPRSPSSSAAPWCCWWP